MRKNIFKKLVTAVVTAAMAIGMVAMPSMDASAAETVYLHGTFNNWGDGVALTSTDGKTFKGDVEMAGSGNMCILLTEGDWLDCGTITSLNDAASFTDGEGEWAPEAGTTITTTPNTGDYTMVGLLLVVAVASAVIVLKRRTVAE